MDTTNLNINSTSGEKSERTGEAKKAAAKAARFAGAAGLGAAGTMAANAMNTHEDEKTEEVSSVPPVTPDATSSEEVTAEAVTDFDPNDIMIEADEVEVVDYNKIETVETTIETLSEDVAQVEPQPITGMVDVQHIADVLIGEDDIHVVEAMYGGPGGWEDFDHDDLLGEDDSFLAGSDDMDEDFDIADDILA